MIRDAFNLAADLVDAGAFKLADAVQAAGGDPAVGIAAALATLRDGDGE